MTYYSILGSFIIHSLRFSYEFMTLLYRVFYWVNHPGPDAAFFFTLFERTIVKQQISFLYTNALIIFVYASST